MTSQDKPSRPVATDADAKDPDYGPGGDCRDGKCGMVSHDEAEQILQRFIDKAFGNRGERPRFSIPANHRYDDDLRLGAYIDQQRAREEASRPVATGSKARAISAVDADALESDRYATYATGGVARLVIEALDRAGFFADEATLAEIAAMRLLREWRAGNPERYFEVRCLESGETRDPWAVRLERESVGWSHEEVAFDDLLRCVQFALREAAKDGEA